MNISISNSYELKYQIIFASDYKVTECGKVFNGKRGKEIKKTICGGSIGWCIKGRFYSQTFLQNQLEEIPNINLPF